MTENVVILTGKLGVKKGKAINKLANYQKYWILTDFYRIVQKQDTGKMLSIYLLVSSNTF